MVMMNCSELLNNAANKNKQVARTDRVLLEDEQYMTNVKSKLPLSPTPSHNYSDIYMKLLSLCFDFLFLFSSKLYHFIYHLVSLIELHLLHLL